MRVTSPPDLYCPTDERNRRGPAEKGHFPIAPTHSGAPASIRARDYFPELDTLRFIAAFFVIVFHGYQSLYTIGVPT